MQIIQIGELDPDDGYFLCDLLMIPRKGADDEISARADEAVPARDAVINPDQWAELCDLIAETTTDEAKFLAYYEVAKLSELRARDYDEARSKLVAKRDAK